MKVKIKEFGLDMAVKNRGIELEIRDTSGKTQLGDLILTKTQIIWCKGKTSRERGVHVRWEDFIAWMESPA
jgi:hypothetical protein